MVFSSPLFLFLFLPIALLVHTVLPFRAKNIWLLLVSLLFYCWGEVQLLGLMLSVVAINYSTALCLVKGMPLVGGELPALVPGGPRTLYQRLVFAAMLVSNLAALAWFKYFNWGIDGFNDMMGMLGLTGAVWQDPPRILLPLGISFYTFQAMSYTMDVYFGNTPPTRSIIRFGTYVVLFPQLVAGPIVRYVDVARELVSRQVTREGFAYGVERFVAGLGKKVLLANVLALPADQVFALDSDYLSAPVAWIGLACYTLQIYYDFSGYSDMAIGMGHMLGFKFLENFRHPYSATSVTDFWRRWHISLSTWFRDYLYIPLGGNRLGTRRTMVNLTVVFLLCGLWHGAASTFVVWGAYHGLLLVIERFAGPRMPVQPPRVLKHAYLLFLVPMGWVFFRCDDLMHAQSFFGALFGDTEGVYRTAPVGELLPPPVLTALIAGALLSFPLVPWLGGRMQQLGAHGGAAAALASLRHVAVAAMVAVVFLLSAMQLSSGTHNPFIYFRF